MAQRRRSSAIPFALATMGIASFAGMLVGLIGALIGEFVIGAPRVDSVRAAALAGGVVLTVGVVVAVVGALRRQR